MLIVLLFCLWLVAFVFLGVFMFCLLLVGFFAGVVIFCLYKICHYLYEFVTDSCCFKCGHRLNSGRSLGIQVRYAKCLLDRATQCSNAGTMDARAGNSGSFIA